MPLTCIFIVFICIRFIWTFRILDQKKWKTKINLSGSTPIVVVGAALGIFMHGPDRWTAKQQRLFKVFCRQRLRDGSMLCWKAIVCRSVFSSLRSRSFPFFSESSISVVFLFDARATCKHTYIIATYSCFSCTEGHTFPSILDIVIYYDYVSLKE